MKFLEICFIKHFDGEDTFDQASFFEISEAVAKIASSQKPNFHLS
jgi:hypothetical protein